MVTFLSTMVIGELLKITILFYFFSCEKLESISLPRNVMCEFCEHSVEKRHYFGGTGWQNTAFLPFFLEFSLGEFYFRMQDVCLCFCKRIFACFSWANGFSMEDLQVPTLPRVAEDTDVSPTHCMLGQLALLHTISMSQVQICEQKLSFPLRSPIHGWNQRCWQILRTM